MMPEGFTLMHLRNVHLDDRRIERVECVENRDRRMRERGRINDDPACRFAGLRLDKVPRLPTASTPPTLIEKIP